MLLAIGENKLFYASIIVSIILHFFLFKSFSAKELIKLKKPAKQIEVSYMQIKSKKVALAKKAMISKQSMHKADLPKDVKLFKKTSQKFDDFTQTLKDISKFSGKLALDKKAAPKIRTLDAERQISIPMIKAEKITNPRYLSYNQTIRQKIRQRAYSYVEHPDFDAGEVYLTFIIDAQGRLKKAQVIEDKTIANSYMRNIGMRSIKEASPFPPFPKDLSYPELTFNVIISFEITD